MSATPQPRKALLFSVSLYVVWLFFTYLLEGRIFTLLRPEAIVDRLVYIVVANFIIGTAVALCIMRPFLASQIITLEQMGFRSIQHTIAAILIAACLVSFPSQYRDPLL